MMQTRNPVIPGFHPDPSIVRVGEDYYIATSTFEWFPGVRIHHSRDLINWELITYALMDEDAVNLTGIDASCGIWAPSLTYCNGLFYLAYTIVHTNRPRFKDTHNFLITAKDIHGPWSPPIPLNRSGFDPSIFHDDDGKKYLVNMTLDYRQERNRFSGIDVQEYDFQSQTLVGKPIRVFRGTEKGFTEGPNIIKHNGYYYLFCAEGGTDSNHCVTVARSTSIYGPYEIDPHNPIMTAAGKINYPLERAGHAQIIQTAEGNWYMVHLCSRRLNGFSILGRETAIQNVHWTENGWLQLSENGESGMPQLYFSPPTEAIQILDHSTKATFENGTIPLEYMTLRRTFASNGIHIENQRLRIRGGCSIMSKFQQGLIARPQQHFNCDYTVAMCFEPCHTGHIAGLVVYYNYDNFYHLRVTRDEQGKKMNVTSVINRELEDSASTILDCAHHTLYLRARIRQETLQFLYAYDDGQFYAIGDQKDMKNISDEHVVGNGFTGSMLGVNCMDLQGDGICADFLWLDYREHWDA